MPSDSMNIGVSGMDAYQAQIDVISNNIANVGTTGYEEQNTSFQDLLYQTQQPGSGPTTMSAGVNYQQVGIGVKIGATDTKPTQGGVQTTAVATNMMINGDGYFILKNANGTGTPEYTRNGDFSLNASGLLFDPSSGQAVMGYTADSAGAITSATPGPIHIPIGLESVATATGAGTLLGPTGDRVFDMSFGGNLDATQYAAAVSNGSVGTANQVTSGMTIYDSLGTAHLVNVAFVPQLANGGVGPPFQVTDPSGTAVTAATIWAYTLGSTDGTTDQGDSTIRKITSTGVVSTLAGAGAQLGQPEGIAVAASGDVYVADYVHNRIKGITPAGVVTTLAGSGTAGWQNGIGTAAQFNAPIGVATDTSGNIYVADAGNSRIRKITSAGLVTFLAGSGNAGYKDGPGAAARFNGPRGVCVDLASNVYVADSGNNRIRKITPAGIVTTLAGSTKGYQDGAATVAQFNDPWGVAVDASGNVYVGDSVNNRIRTITPAGAVSTLAGGTQGYLDGIASLARFYEPMGVAVNTSGDVYVADLEYSRIREISGAASPSPSPTPTIKPSSAPTVTGFVVKLTSGGTIFDLHVFEPGKTHVYYMNLHGLSGWLDCGYALPTGSDYATYPTFMNGKYIIGVNYYAGGGTQIATVYITAGAQTKHYTQAFTMVLGPSGDASPTTIATVVVTTVGGVRTFTILP